MTGTSLTLDALKHSSRQQARDRSSALATVETLIRPHLRMRVVTNLPATIELSATVNAGSTTRLQQREENKETEPREVKQRGQTEHEGSHAILVPCGSSCQRTVQLT